MTSDSNNKFEKLDQLLRLKRYEKPSADFWNKFDSELKRKTLRSIVKKESRIKRAFRSFSFFFKNPIISLSTATLFVFSLYLSVGTFTQPLSAELDAETREINKILNSGDLKTELVCQNLKTSDSNNLHLVSGSVLSRSSDSSSFRINTLY